MRLGFMEGSSGAPSAHVVFLFASLAVAAEKLRAERERGGPEGTAPLLRSSSYIAN
jgi:hypothetical protein